MEGLTIVESSVLTNLIEKFETAINAVEELKRLQSPYMTAQQVMEYTGFGKNWIRDNREAMGFISVGGSLRFKREDVEEYMEANYYKTKRRK